MEPQEILKIVCVVALLCFSIQTWLLILTVRQRQRLQDQLDQQHITHSQLS